MDLALWIVGSWIGLSVAVALWVTAFIRDNRGLHGVIPLPVRAAAVRRPGRGAPPR